MGVHVVQNWAKFMQVNKLRQIDLANYLGISEPSVSQLIHGHHNLRKSNLDKVLNNPEWDTSMLISEYKEIESSTELINKLKAATKRAEKAEALCNKYLEIIDKLATYISNG